jgi:hypothetical protein
MSTGPGDWHRFKRSDSTFQQSPVSQQARMLTPNRPGSVEGPQMREPGAQKRSGAPLNSSSILMNN